MDCTSVVSKPARHPSPSHRRFVRVLACACSRARARVRVLACARSRYVCTCLHACSRLHARFACACLHVLMLTLQREHTSCEHAACAHAVHAHAACARVRELTLCVRVLTLGVRVLTLCVCVLRVRAHAVQAPPGVSQVNIYMANVRVYFIQPALPAPCPRACCPGPRLYVSLRACAHVTHIQLHARSSR